MKLNSNYVIKNLADETILVYQDEQNVDFTKIINLNEVAVVIINKIEEGLNVEQIGEFIASEYDVDAETATNDAKAFINQLVDSGIVEL